MKAIIPCGGLGTRMNPTSEYIPKELMPIWDKPAVYYTIREALNAGLFPIVLVVSPSKLDMFMKVFPSMDCGIKFVIQDSPSGLGPAIACALNDCDESASILLPDEFIPDGISKLLDSGRNILVKKIPPQKRCEYGMIETDLDYNILSIHEKPKCECIYNLGIIGRYVLNNNVLSRLRSGHSLDYVLNIACAQNRLTCCEYYGTRYDTGCREGWMSANIHVALQNDYKLQST